MKVLVLTTTFPRWKDDTTPLFIYDLSKCLKEVGHKIIILAPHHSGAEFEEDMDGLKIYRFPYFFPLKYQNLCYEGGILPNIKRKWLARLQIPVLLISELFWTLRLIRKERINLIHSHWLVPSGLVGSIVSRFFRIPHITTAHAGDVFTMEKIIFLGPIWKFILANSHIITVNSNFTKKSVENISINLEKNPRMEVIPMGVDTKVFNPSWEKLNLPSNNKIIFSVGRLVEKKGFEYLIKAMPIILEEIPNAKLVIAGSGPNEYKLKNLVKSLNIENTVVFLGYIKSSVLPKHYGEADVFVLPSIKTKGGDTEGLGVVLLEAMACGTVVVGSNIGGITDIITDGQNGFLSEPENPRSLADTIVKILSDDDLRRRFSENGLRTVEEKFSWKVVTKKFGNIYNSL